MSWLCLLKIFMYINKTESFIHLNALLWSHSKTFSVNFCHFKLQKTLSSILSLSFLYNKKNIYIYKDLCWATDLSKLNCMHQEKASK